MTLPKVESISQCAGEGGRGGETGGGRGRGEVGGEGDYYGH